MIDRLLPQLPPQVQADARARNNVATSFLDVLTATGACESSAQVSAATGEDAVPHLFEFHGQRGDGEIEVFALPWRLKSSSSLAQRTAMYGQELLAQVGASAPVRAGTGVGSEAARTAALPSAPVVASTRVDAPETAAIARLPVVPEPAGSPTERELGAGAAPAAFLPWSKRLVRWVEGQEDRASVWIRDYRLDDEAARQLGEAVRAAAREHGVLVRKVVVNAREIWRNAAGNF